MFIDQRIFVSTEKERKLGGNIMSELTLKERIHAGETIIGVGLSYTVNRDYLQSPYCHFVL